MKVLSLFDGIAGARQALKNLNIDCKYYACEIDRFAIQVAKNNHPDIVHIGDVRFLQCSPVEGLLSKPRLHNYCNNIIDDPIDIYCDFDLLCCGSPCQDLSIAKKDRSSLFYEYVRILKEVKPKFFILENVASMSKESKELILKELFNIEPVMINSGLLTAQQRKCLYWVGKLQEDGTYEKVEISQPQDNGNSFTVPVIEHILKHLFDNKN